MMTRSEGANVNLKKARKNLEMQLQLDIYKGVPMGNNQHKVQEEYEALAQGHGGTKKGLLDLREDSQHGNQMQKGFN